MDIENIRYVIAISKYRSYTLAAEEMAISESSLSKRIQKLEAELGGIALFDRSTRRVSLTEAGEVFLTHAETIVNEHDEMLNSLQKISSQQMNAIRIGVIPLLGKMGLSACIARFYEKYPDVCIQLHEGRSGELVLMQKYGKLDVIFVVVGEECFENRDNWNISPIISDQIVAVVPQNHRFARRSSIGLELLAEETLILLTRESTTRTIIDRAFAQYGVAPKRIQECAQVDMIFDLVEAQMGVTILAKKVFENAPHENITKIIPLAEPLMRTTVMVTPKDQGKISKFAKAFCKHVLTDPVVNLDI